MNTFHLNETLGDYGECYIYLSMLDIYRDVRKVPKEMETQLKWADIVRKGSDYIGINNKRIEVKTEENDPNGNFFIERWSNKSIGREGWLYSSPADELYYIFWNENYGFRFPNWQNSAWMIRYNSSGYTLIKQGKTQQNNDTWGYLVPQDSLGEVFSPIKFILDDERKTHVKNIVDNGSYKKQGAM